MDRIISKEKEREDPRRDSSKTSFQLESKSISSVSTRNPATTTTSLILHTELILSQETPKKYKNYKAHPVQIVRRHPPATVPCASKYSTRQNQAPRPLQYKQASSNSTQQKQHSTRQPASTCSLQLPGAIHLVLQGIHLVFTKFYKGLSITLHCNTTRSVCSKLLLLALRIILQEN